MNITMTLKQEILCNIVEAKARIWGSRNRLKNEKKEIEEITKQLKNIESELDALYQTIKNSKL